MYDVIIIGGGPAGLTAGIYLKRAGKTALLVEAEAFGGQIITSPEVENYPGIAKVSGYELAMKLFEQATDLGLETESDKIIGISEENDGFTVKGESGDYRAKSVIIATGAKARKLGLENEDRLTGSGVSYCAVCDGAFFRDRVVAVNGGGNTAFEDAIFLSAYCKKVYLIHRRREFRAEENLVSVLRAKPNVEFVLDSTVTSLVGQDKLEAVVLRDKNTDGTSTLPLDGLFVSVGRTPDTGYLKGFVGLDEGGYIVAGEDCKTDRKGVFVAGDCRRKLFRQLTTAASDGTVAALNACAYLELK